MAGSGRRRLAARRRPARVGARRRRPIWVGTWRHRPHRVLPRRVNQALRPGHHHVTGVVNAGGTEKPGRAIDHATFASGSFRIDHSAGKPSVRFDSATCVGTITQAGPFKVIDATGHMSGLAGRGQYVFRALYTTARAGTHCTSTMTAYTEAIEAVAKVKA
jgi:hypothetical protein